MTVRHDQEAARRRGVRARLARVVRALRAGGSLYLRHFSPQMAAAVSYHVLFSVFPLAILLVAVLGLVLQNERVHEEVLGWLLDTLPLSDSAARSLEQAVSGIASPLSAAGLLAVLGLLWSASAMMGAIRTALAALWSAVPRRPAARGKALDLALVAAAALLVLVSFVLTILVRVVERSSAGAADSLGAFGSVVTAAGSAIGILLPLALSFVTFVLLYRYVPPARPPLRDVVAGALLAAGAFELLKAGFAFYLAHFADYNAIYGSLGAVVAFLFFVYLAASALLFGAAVAASWARTAMPEPSSDPPVSLPAQLLGLLRGLWTREDRRERDAGRLR